MSQGTGGGGGSGGGIDPALLASIQANISANMRSISMNSEMTMRNEEEIGLTALDLEDNF